MGEASRAVGASCVVVDAADSRQGLPGVQTGHLCRGASYRRRSPPAAIRKTHDLREHCRGLLQRRNSPSLFSSAERTTTERERREGLAMAAVRPDMAGRATVRPDMATDLVSIMVAETVKAGRSSRLVLSAMN
eukprot:363186-Chlamydomonas_euryale.AAC.5